jgi:hypothetical protein
LADALERMRAWTQLESTQVKVENVGAAQVNIDGDITVPMTLRADYGDQSAQHTLALQFTETTDQPNAWTLTALNDDRYQRRYIWPEPPEHAAWCVTRRLERAAAAHAAGDAAGYAQAITGDAEHADDFIDFLAEYGPDRYRFIVSSVEAPTDLDHGVHANAALTANADRVQLEGVFYWQSDQWLAASPSDWLKSTLTARRVLRKLRSGDWVEAHALFADLPPDEKSRAQSAIDATTFPAAWRSGASDQSDPATGLPLWFDDADQIRYRLVMTDWPDAGGRYALYVQEIETSTAQWMQAWPQVAGELKKRGASNGDLTEDWNQRNAMEVRDPLQDAISSVTWKQALTFARLRERDLPSEAEWLVAAGVLDVDPSRLVGGVWEWCRDEEGDGHVIRGGCWLNAVDGTPTTDLRSVQGRVPDETIGFRTVIRIPPQRIP